MFQTTFLGTAASVPSASRGLPAILIRHGGQGFLIDCGEGTQRQILTSGNGFRGIETVLLTHGHLDHVLGLAGLLSTMNLWRTTSRVDVFGGAAALRAAEALVYKVAWPDGGPALDIRFHSLNSGPVLEGKGLRVSAFPVRHSGPDSFGFRFEEPSHRPLLPDRLKECGVPEGEIRGRLARGEAVHMPDGSRIEPEDVLGPPKSGASLAVVGDTENIEDLTPHVRNADGLIIEATFLDRDASKAQDRSHITARKAAELAAAAEVGILWLTHISGRYAVEDILSEARAIFPNSHVAQDFAQAEIRPRPTGDAGNPSPPETLKSRTD